jgi:hypothetical protein
VLIVCALERRNVSSVTYAMKRAHAQGAESSCEPVEAGDVGQRSQSTRSCMRDRLAATRPGLGSQP